ncbi:ABC transporter ATP-binding protein [Candidatus Bipolaricaulota bacterium]|nr:ABC transporter ATP-binding protein [Candidatus Bipolaricaulota bacterium]
MERLLEVKGLTKMYSIGSVMGGVFSRRRILAVEGVSFDIKPAEIFTLAGESGCGKTTTAKIILGFERPTTGEVFFKGKPASIWRKKRLDFLREVQAVFQNPFETFNPLRTVEDLFFETIFNYKITRHKEEAKEVAASKLEAVGLSLEEVYGRYPSELSGGQLQRASLARALLTEPSLLVADEPVSMVDASLRMSIVNLFKKLTNEFGLSVLYITHDLATAYYVSDRIAIMFRGNLIEMGPVEAVLMTPKHPYTKLLRESVPEADPKRKWTEEIALSDIEYQEYLRGGCKFAGRCPTAEDRCKRERPRELFINGTMVRCHKYEAHQGNGRLIGAEPEAKAGHKKGGNKC